MFLALQSFCMTENPQEQSSLCKTDKNDLIDGLNVCFLTIQPVG